MLTKAEKEKRVIELFEQDKTYREIAQEVHMSPNDISNVVKRHRRGSTTSNRRKTRATTKAKNYRYKSFYAI